MIFSFANTNQIVKYGKILVSMVIPSTEEVVFCLFVCLFVCLFCLGLLDQRTLAVRVKSAAANVAATRSETTLLLNRFYFTVAIFKFYFTVK